MEKYRRADEIAADTTIDPLDKIAELAVQNLDNFMNMLSPPTHKDFVGQFINRVTTFASNNVLMFHYTIDMDYQLYRLRFTNFTHEEKCVVELSLNLDSLRSFAEADFLANHVIRNVKREFGLEQL